MKRSTFDHAFTIAFSLQSICHDAGDVSASDLRIALLRRLASLPDDELLEAVGAPYDSYEIVEGGTHEGDNP